MRLIPVTDSSRIAGRKIQYKVPKQFRFPQFKQAKPFFLDQNCNSVSFIYPTLYSANVVSSVDAHRLGIFRDFVDCNCQGSINSNGVINGTCSFSQKLMIGSISFDAHDSWLLNAKPIKAEQVPKGVRDKLEI